MNNKTEELRHRSSTIAEHTALGLGFFNAIAAAGWFFLHYHLGSFGLLAVAYVSLCASITSFFAALHAGIERRAAEESLRTIDSDHDHDALFEGVADDQGEKQQIWLQFERWFQPLFVLALIIFETLFAYYLSSRIPLVRAMKLSPVESENFNYGIILVLGVAAFALFIAGKYAAGFAYPGNRRHLRAPAALTIFSSLFLVVTIIAFLCSKFAVSSDNPAWRNPDSFLLYAGILTLAIFAINNVIVLVLSFYRSKSSPERSLPLYENHVAGLFAQPEGVWRGFAEIVDYQFGFKISQTHFYAFFLKAVFPLLAIQLVSLALLSCVIVVPAGKRAFVERWGRKTSAPLEPGLHFKAPWPVETVFHSPADRVQTIRFGSYVKKEDAATSNSHLWNDLAEDAPLFITAEKDATDTSAQSSKRPNPATGNRPVPVVNLVAVSALAQYWVKNSESYYYNVSDPERILQKLAEKELTSYLATHDGLSLLSGNCRQLNEHVAKRLNSLCDTLSLGVEIISVCVEQIQPPTQKDTVGSFHKIMIQEQKSKSVLFKAEQYKNKEIPAAKTQAVSMVNEAKSYEVWKLSSIKAETEVFSQKMKLYHDYRDLYTTLSFLDATAKALEYPIKTVIAVDTDHQVIQFDLKNDLNPNLLDMSMETE